MYRSVRPWKSLWSQKGWPRGQLVNSTPLGGTLASSTATASVTLPNGISVISATATFATALAGLDAPIMIEGGEVKWVRVAAPYGGGSTVTYITSSGREFAMR